MLMRGAHLEEGKNFLYTFEKATVDSVDWDRSDPTHSLSQSVPSKRSVDPVDEGC